MERDGQLMTNRKGQLCVVAKLDLVTGTVQGHPDGFGFLVPDDGTADLFLSPKEMHKALHGDRATARQIGLDNRGRPEGVIVDVLERVNREVVGRVYEDHGIWYLVAENKRISQDILVPPDMRGKARPGQVVVAELVEQPSRASRSAGARSCRCSATTPIRAWKSRSRCASTICRTNSPPPRSARRRGCRPRCRTPTARTAST